MGIREGIKKEIENNIMIDIRVRFGINIIGGDDILGMGQSYKQIYIAYEQYGKGDWE